MENEEKLSDESDEDPRLNQKFDVPMHVFERI
jgi:hypothetical protein